MFSSVSCSTSDPGFFSASKTAKTGTSTASAVTVTTRVARRAIDLNCDGKISHFPGNLPTSQSTPRAGSQKKRKYLPLDPCSLESPNLPRAVKRLRASDPTHAPRGRAGSSSSRASSHRPSSPEPIYRSDRSRSASLYPSNDSLSPLCNRRWTTDNDGYPGKNLESSETVVKKLMKSYRACLFFSLPFSFRVYSTFTDFTNPDDPHDSSFEPHPDHYPVVELEYPNQGASERFVPSVV